MGSSLSFLRTSHALIACRLSDAVMEIGEELFDIERELFNIGFCAASESAQIASARGFLLGQFACSYAFDEVRFC